MDTVTTDQHSFVAITVVPVEAVLEDDGTMSYRHAELMPDQDVSPELFCQLCWQPMTPVSVQTNCSGPKVPDDPGELFG